MTAQISGLPAVPRRFIRQLCPWVGLMLISTCVPGIADAEDVVQCTSAQRTEWLSQENHDADVSLDRFHTLRRELRHTFMQGDYAKVRSLAAEYLELARKYPCYDGYGDAIYNTNAYLGRISLIQGSIADADNYLLQAGKTPGSRALNSLGPDLWLADQLLRHGERTTVISFLQEIRSFWTPGQTQIDSWITDIKAGKRPILNQLFGSSIRTKLPMVFLLGMLLVPVIWVVFALRRRIRHIAGFFVAACLVVYALEFAVLMAQLPAWASFAKLLVPTFGVHVLYIVWRWRFKGPVESSPAPSRQHPGPG